MEPNNVSAHKLTYSANTGQVLAILMRNVLFNIITLGIYNFWGKTRLRKFLLSQLSLNGESFVYLGNGKELCKGFFKIILIVSLPIIILTVIGNALSMAEVMQNIVSFIVIILIVCGKFLAMRYRMSRTTWHGIRFRMSGKVMKYALTVSYCWLMKCISFGLLIPSMDIKRLTYLSDNSYYGSLKFDCQMAKDGLFKVNLITLLLAIPTVGLSRCWYNAALLNNYFAGLSIGGVSMKSSFTGGALAKFYLLNMLIIMLTLGIGMPLIAHRKMAFMAPNIWFEGDIASLKAQQSAEILAKSGEGLESVLGDGSDLGIL